MPHLTQKIEKLILAVRDCPRLGVGKPEKLNGFESRNVWSRRITEKDRIIYEIDEGNSMVTLLHCGGHYKNIS
jgi:toxin YoeB